ncbi:MAG: TlpA family protein disulfide reductase [Gemmatimonadota bacterium]|nr:TlpA family protein disulfide reductase [Gemmatimonadota bacterium]MDE3127287.1 TlpA family protein disulfide reductase [Gemmatimonadota bacterium]MDE3173259.1 TlpA family protein disulfide reductase [Gemmatimonadota bacterium]MDE3215863.1 TlpA family protein disulfide reductase [Gemmatimonadota bacterium]
MTARRQWAVIVAVIVALGVGSYAFERAFGGNVQQVGVGAQAPPFSARMVDGSGRIVHLSDFRGHVILLNVWATWCGPCKAEMPTLETLYRMYAPQGLRIVAVSIDETASDDSVRDYARNMGLTFDILHDPQYRIEQAYQVTGYPSSYVIDRNGVIRKIWLGAADWASEGNIALVRQLLGLPAAVAAR